MILIAGATGRIGPRIVRLLVDRGLGVRVIARDRTRVSELEEMGAEVLVGDIRDSDAVDCAAEGARTVVSAISGFGGGRDISPRSVDRDGNRNLISAGERAGAEHFVLLSTYGAGPTHPIELFRMKYLAEQSLLASALSPTILRCTAFMETWAMLLGEPLLKTGRTRIFGRGESPINFVSADDVARFVELAVTDPGMRGATVDIGGPQNLTMNRFVEIFESEAGMIGEKSHVPRPVMRGMARLLKHVNPTVAGQIRAAVVMDTTDMSYDASRTTALYPTVSLTSLVEVIRRSNARTPATLPASESAPAARKTAALEEDVATLPRP